MYTYYLCQGDYAFIIICSLLLYSFQTHVWSHINSTHQFFLLLVELVVFSYSFEFEGKFVFTWDTDSNVRSICFHGDTVKQWIHQKPRLRPSLSEHCGIQLVFFFLTRSQFNEEGEVRAWHLLPSVHLHHQWRPLGFPPERWRHSRRDY